MPTKPHHFAAENVATLRSQSDMSRRELIDRLAEYDVKLQQTSLRRIEEGAQQIKLDELIAFSQIFEIGLDDLLLQPVDQLHAQMTYERNRYNEQLHNLERAVKDFATARGRVADTLKPITKTMRARSKDVDELAKTYEASSQLAKNCVPLMETFRLGIPELDENLDRAIGYLNA